MYGQLDDVPSSLALYVPLSQGAQEVAVEKGSALGKDMYVPGRQQPNRPVEPVDKENARGQHKLCVKPLLWNTLNRNKQKL